MADINAQVARMHAAIAAGLPADRPGVPRPAVVAVDVQVAILAELRAVRKLLERLAPHGDAITTRQEG